MIRCVNNADQQQYCTNIRHDIHPTHVIHFFIAFIYLILFRSAIITNIRVYFHPCENIKILHQSGLVVRKFNRKEYWKNIEITLTTFFNCVTLWSPFLILIKITPASIWFVHLPIFIESFYLLGCITLSLIKTQRPTTLN